MKLSNQMTLTWGWETHWHDKKKHSAIMGPSPLLLLPLKTDWHFCKCHSFTSFSEDHFHWWCSWVIRQPPQHAPPHLGRSRWRRENYVGSSDVNGDEKRIKDNWSEPRGKLMSGQLGAEIWRVASHTADTSTALYSSQFSFQKNTRSILSPPTHPACHLTSVLGSPLWMIF